MRVLHIGATGSLGSRVVAALIAHNHTVVVYVRSPTKLRTLLPPALIDRVEIFQGDAFDTATIAQALRDHSCDALVNTAGTREPFHREQTLPKLVASITNAARQVGKERGKPLRVWITGGLSSLKYPGTKYQIQDYMPGWLLAHQYGVEQVVRSIPVEELKWSLLCVAMMYPESETVEMLDAPRTQRLVVSYNGTPPSWEDSWVRSIPVLGVFLNLIPAINSYRSKYEDVADLIGRDLATGKSDAVGKFVGFKEGAMDE